MAKKQTKTEFITTRVTPRIKAKIERIAREESRTLSMVVALLVIAGLEARRNGNGG